MIQEVISHHMPGEWSSARYDKTFIKFPVSRYTEEYDKVVSPFQSLSVASVERIQNPYIWGRFKLRKEQLERKTTIYEHVMYHPVDLRDVDIVAEYNCDYRRYKSAQSAQYSGKQPKMYKTPKLATESYRYSSAPAAIVVVRVLHDNISVSSVELKGWESEYAPEYIVTLE